MIKKEIEGAALLSIYNELKDEIKAIRTDIHLMYLLLVDYQYYTL